MCDDNKYCLGNILKVITVLQENSNDEVCNERSCSRPFLGNGVNVICFNTRLVNLYRCDNSLITLPYTTNGIVNETSIFRVMKVNSDSINVLLIEDNGDGTYQSTNTYATINLKCVCAMQCIGDIALNNL